MCPSQKAHLLASPFVDVRVCAHRHECRHTRAVCLHVCICEHFCAHMSPAHAHTYMHTRICVVSILCARVCACACIYTYPYVFICKARVCNAYMCIGICTRHCRFPSLFFSFGCTWQHVGPQFPEQESILCSLQWKCEVWTAVEVPVDF